MRFIGFFILLVTVWPDSHYLLARSKRNQKGCNFLKKVIP